jgi:hypothetical protein
MPSKSIFVMFSIADALGCCFVFSYDVDGCTAEMDRLSQQALHARDAAYECFDNREC